MVLCEEEFDLLTHCNDGQRSNALKRTLPIVAVGLVWTNALAIALGSGLPVVAAEVRVQSIKERAGDLVWRDALAIALGTGVPVVAAEVKEQSINGRAADDVPHIQLAQFQLPEHKKEMFRRRGADPPSPLIQRLKFEYSYGSESEIVYRADPDLNTGVKDNLLILTPELNGFIRYRPTDWLEGTLEMIFAGEIPVLKEDSIVLADGEIQMVPDTQFSLLVDQLYVTIKDITAPFRFTVGRRNYEDERHWLYDTSMDIASVSVKLGKFRAEVLAGREVMWHLDLITKEERDLINTYIFYADYRGIEDIKLAAYTIYRDDREGLEGRPLFMGVRSQGAPSETFSYWLELAHMRGSDVLSRDFSAFGLDVGATYRFLDLPFNPNFTMGFAFGSGDDPNTGTNTEFRQTGLQSNEARFAGVSEFKTYGEALDPELSNLKILTVGLGFRPAPDVSLDFVYHHYWLDEFADEIRNSALTAQMNQVDTRLSKDVGNAFDVVLGVRSLFGVRRLGLDLRMGWFFPGKAFLRDDGDEINPNIRDADLGWTIVTKFWW